MAHSVGVFLPRHLIAAGVFLGLFTGAALAQDGRNVLLVQNMASPDSQQIAGHYADVRHIPSENIVSLTTAISEEIDRAEFSAHIETPIAAAINHQGAQDRILYIVLTKGIPLRIRGTAGQDGSTASVDSELTLLYRKLLGIQVPTAGPITNPYFQNERPLQSARLFSHDFGDIYLVTRLDGFTVADVLKLIDRGIAPSQEGKFLLDQRATVLGDRTGDAWLSAAANALAAKGLGDRVVLESSTTVLSGRQQVLGYYSWGSNDPAIKRRRFDLGFVPGALAGMYVSTDARTFKEPPASWSIGAWSDPKTFFEGSPQSLTGDLIREGVTGVAGHVAEPYLAATIRPQILFPAYVSGFNLAESFYLAMPYLSWETIVIGDPLCAPFRREMLSTDLAAPKLDPETQAPPFYTARRLAATSAVGVRPDVAKLLIKADGRLAAGDKAGAQETFEAAVKIDPRLTVAQLALALLYEQAGDHDKSIEKYRAILAYTPNEFVSLNNLAYALAVYKGAPAEALPLAEKAYQISSGLATVADTLGWVHHLMGKQTEAERYIGDAVKADPMNATTHVHLAAVYEATNRRDLAKVELAKAVDLDRSLENADEVRNLRQLFSNPAGWVPTPRR